jgi:uncharacterized protein
VKYPNFELPGRCGLSAKRKVPFTHPYTRRENPIAVRFAYEWHDDASQWYRSYGNELWKFDHQGLMRVRHASINDSLISTTERKYHWPLGRRPDDLPSLSDLGF